MDHGLSEADWGRSEWELGRRADRRGDAEGSKMEKTDWKTVADCWRRSELWNVTMETGAGHQVKVTYPAQGDPPYVTLFERPEYSKVAMEKGLAAIEAVEAKLEPEPPDPISTYGIITYLKAKENWGVDRVGWILEILIALCEDSDGPGADLEWLSDQLNYRVNTGTWKE